MPIKPDLKLMQAAIDVAVLNKTPFGAVLAMGDEIFVTAANQTKQLSDPTAHAELLAIRKLAGHLQKTDLSGFTLYTTCEPCPMCMSAAIWAKVDGIIYGCSIGAISEFMDQINVRSEYMNKFALKQVKITGGFMENECYNLLRWYS